MRRLHLIILIALLTTFTAAARKNHRLVILHTNDTHSCILPLKEALQDTMLAGRGGFVRRVAMISEERKKNPDMLLFDSGDFSQGSSYYTMFKGDVEVGLMNLMGYDAVTIGNHEFDFGLDNMARLFRMAKFPIVCSNYDFTGSVLDGLVKPYITLKRQGLKIGVFASCPRMAGLVAKQNYGPLKFLDPATTAQKYINLLRNEEKCDMVICISHLGWEVSEYPDEKFLRQTEGCDLVLGGHTHTYMPSLEYAPDRNGRPVAVDQNGKHGAFVGRLVIEIEK